MLLCRFSCYEFNRLERFPDAQTQTEYSFYFSEKYAQLYGAVRGFVCGGGSMF